MRWPFYIVTLIMNYDIHSIDLSFYSTDKPFIILKDKICLSV